VLGDGKLGGLCAQVLSSAGAQVCVVGKYPHKLALLHQLGMATVLLSDWRPRLADIVVEVTVQVMKTGLTPQLAPSDHLREAEKEQLHPAEQLHTLR